LGVVYLTAFLVAANQNEALLGHSGLLPMDIYLHRVQQYFGSPGKSFLNLPSLFWWKNSDTAMMTVAWTGVALSAIVVCGYANSMVMLVLWILYLSIVNVGQLWSSY